ncbi:MAG: hypothetical protein ACTSR3_12475 [Candidatus Helarchaeota archaeon]
MPDEIGEKLVNFIKYSLNSMSSNFTNLSKLNFNDVSDDLKKKLIEQKIQEQPFTYEFYHQFRKYWALEAMKKVFGTSAYIQVQVNRAYQNISDLDRMPDFLINEPDSDKNIAVIEFKMANRKDELKKDIKKLVLFRKKLNYSYLIEILIGNEKELEEASKFLKQIGKNVGDEIIFILFDPKLKKVDSIIIKN